MKKNTLFFTITLLLFVIFVTSCQKKVIDEVVPADRLSSDLAFSTPQKIESATIGSYNALQSAEFLSGRALIYVDLMGEDVFDANGFFGQLSRFNMLSNAGQPAGVWNAAYRSIITANRVMEGIAANPTIVTAAKAKELTAECKFVRAVSYFYLVNYFAQPYVFTANASHPGVPLILKSFNSNDPEANQPRSTVAEVYNRIITDLTESLTDLPVTYSSVYQTKTRATKAAAASLLSRVYLYKGDYANCKTVSLAVINGTYGTYALQNTPNGAFGPGKYQTSETIWSIPNSATDNPNTNNALPQHYFPSGRGDIAVSRSFTSIATNPYFALDDRRRAMLIPGNTPATTAFTFTNKYPDVATRSDWAPIIRYAEVLLNYAEAAARTAAVVDADAIAKLNLVRDRSRVSEPSYSVLSFPTTTSLVNAILGERRIELAFEGHRFWDLQRIKANVSNKYDNDGSSLLPVQPFGNDKNVFPIPQAEIDKSRGVLKQNASY